MLDTPVYLVTGFLEAGKTKFINDTMNDPKFTDADRVLVIACEEGEEEFDDFAVEYIDDISEITPENMIRLQKRHDATKIVIEYNGMWQLSQLFERAPEHWIIGQNILFVNAETFEGYNKNMRSLVVDKIQNADLIIFNRVDDVDCMELHKIVRGLSRGANIIYEKSTGETAYDDIEDPLPFDKDADIIVIEDRDYALFYRDLSEDMAAYDGKTVRFKAIVAKDKSLGTGTMFVGRHIMICCADDIQYSPLVCKWGRSDDWESYDWVTVEAKIKIAHHKAYQTAGPVLTALSVTKAYQPTDPVATFY